MNTTLLLHQNNYVYNNWSLQMVDWKLLYNKYGQKKSAEKFEDMALEYVRDMYSEYTWRATGRTRDGNRDFHNLENDLLSIWGEAKYKKSSISLTRKDLDPTILSGLIDGTVELIIFVTNGKIPDPLVTRMVLGANMKGIKISFVTGIQLSDWLILNPDKYKTYFGETYEKNVVQCEQLVAFKKVSFYEPISLDFNPNFNKVSMKVDDTFILICSIMSTKKSVCKIELEDNAPLSFVNSEKYENPNNFEIQPGLNAISFLVRAIFKYNNVLRIALYVNGNKYYHVSNRIVINKNKQLDIYYFEQLDILNKIKCVIDNFDNTIGSYIFFIRGCSGMGKSYILNELSLDYSLNNDLTLVTFEYDLNSNVNYMLLCRIIIFLQYGNVFWDFSISNIKKFCINLNSLNGNLESKLLNNLLNGCFDDNIAKTTILKIIKITYKNMPTFIHSKFQKNFRILLLDDIQYLNKEQSTFLKIIIKQQLTITNNNIILLSGRLNEFRDSTLEKKLLESISNCFELTDLSEKDKEGTVLQNFTLKEKKLLTPFFNELPSNLLMLNEVLSNLKYSLGRRKDLSNSQLIDYYISSYDKGLIFQSKFEKIKEQYYLLDIIYLFKKGIRNYYLYEYPEFDKNNIKQGLKLLSDMNCIRFVGNNMIFPFHDFLVENYRSLRKGKEFNKTTGDFLKFLLTKNQKEIDANYILSMICKCGTKYFKQYNKIIQDLMLQYINKSEFGTAVYFAELFYNNISNKNHLTKTEKYYLYLYADCLVHCDNKYRAKQLLLDIAGKEAFESFERYEALISLLNQRFWSVELKGVIEDSKMYQIDLENMFIDHLNSNMIGRVKKSYESCFNRRMVTLLLLDNYREAQKTYREGLCALKTFSEQYHLNDKSEMATIIMDYARGNMARNPNLSYRLFLLAIKFYDEKKGNYIRRTMICHIDLKVIENIIGKKTNYKKFIKKINQLYEHNFLAEYVKGLMKMYACRMVDYSRANNANKISFHFMEGIINQIEKVKLENQMVLYNRELYLYNYIMAYFYIVQNELELARTCLQDNLEYIKEAGKTYKLPLEHNIKNLETIKTVEWFQDKKKYLCTVFILESRFW